MKMEYIYQWQAVNKKGNIVKGESIGQSRQSVFQHLSHLDLQPYTIKCKKLIHYSEKEIAYRLHFIHQLSTLLASGIPLLKGIIMFLIPSLNEGIRYKSINYMIKRGIMDYHNSPFLWIKCGCLLSMGSIQLPPVNNLAQNVRRPSFVECWRAP
ncbi:hypothetical protein XBP1_1760009 [Xenorhabdus bovienii str. puntauvense]|uniref:Uncharacterized protein n=1 Tax=Xenorhabdus bovienii str. puntauvense TaxID=1398201 RepID=A0A077NA96_XENBV|nr:hypothetical protein XBP1_1760009 [Xenorhabdus bovienii str. puntauvense]